MSPCFMANVHVKIVFVVRHLISVTVESALMVLNVSCWIFLWANFNSCIHILGIIKPNNKPSVHLIVY